MCERTKISNCLSPLKGLLPCVGPHVIPELTLCPQKFPADVTGEFVLQEHLVLHCHVVVLPGLPSVPGAQVALPLLVLALALLVFWDLDAGLANVLLHVPRPGLLLVEDFATGLTLVILEDETLHYRAPRII